MQLPALEVQPNVTVLDLQIKKLRDAAVVSITQMAIRMREDFKDVRSTVGEIEDWLDRLRQLAEEVHDVAFGKVLGYLAHQAMIVNSSEMSPSASEQHARCDHMDVERRKEGGLCPSPGQPDPVLQLQ